METTLFTTHGELPVALLRQKIVKEDAPDGYVTATEYYLGEEMVRRDVHVELKPHAYLRMVAQLPS